MIREVLALMFIFTAAVAHGQAPDIPGETVPRNVPPPVLFEELNYDLPGMEAVKAAVDAGDERAAKAALLEYFRSRPGVAHPSPRENPDTTRADALLEGRFVWPNGDVLYWGPDVEDIEWYRVPMDIDWPTFDHEIGRGTYVLWLSRAYLYTGEDKYVQRLVDLMLEFIRDCPVEDGRAMPRINNMDGYAVRLIGREALATEGHPAMYWTLMAAMRRTQQWANFFRDCVTSEAVTPDALATILTSLIEHERFIVDALPTIKHGNHGTRNATTVLEIAAKFPEITEREQWADRGMEDLLRRYNYKDRSEMGFYYRDGASDEISVEVGRGDYYTLLQAMKWIEMLGREIPAQLREIQEKNIQYYAWLTFPTELPWRAAHHRRGPHLPGREDIDYIESGGREGTVPERASWPLHSGDPSWAGTYFMRSDWTPEAVALRVRFGPIQYKYSMGGLGDVGDIGVWGYGMHLIPHMYHHPRSGPFREYGDRSFCGSGRSENTISVDGVGQSKHGRVRYITEPLDNPWLTTPVFDYVRGGYSFDPEQVAVTHTRAVLFVKPDYFVILDRSEGEGEHEYRMKYQLHQDLSAEADGTWVTAMSADGPGVVVAPTRDDLNLTIIEGQMKPEVEGWHLVSDTKAEPAPALIYTWREPAPTRVETVIRPLAPGAQADLEVTREVDGDTVRLTIYLGERTDVI
ncbi:MAG: heparinase II/III family protein, partial [Armatimonadetes bacterium]|nr:heparinase II/III family protein [Armatimonadota bacterium]